MAAGDIAAAGVSSALVRCAVTHAVSTLTHTGSTATYAVSAVLGSSRDKFRRDKFSGDKFSGGKFSHNEGTGREMCPT